MNARAANAADRGPLAAQTREGATRDFAEDAVSRAAGSELGDWTTSHYRSRSRRAAG